LAHERPGRSAKELFLMASHGSAEEKRQRAQSHFEKAEQRKVEAAKSLDEHRAKQDADAAKTLRLRTLRLAKEAQDEAVAKQLSAEKAEKEAAQAASKAARKNVARKKVAASES
jgi:hypothetical protein